MQTRFVTLSVEMGSSGLSLRSEIEAALAKYGEPLRWAVVAVQGMTAQIEAVVIRQNP